MPGQPPNTAAVSWDGLWASSRQCMETEGRQTLGAWYGRLHSLCLLLGYCSPSGAHSCQQLGQSTRTLEQP